VLGKTPLPPETKFSGFAWILRLPIIFWQALFFLGPLLFLIAMSFFLVKNYRMEEAFELKNWHRMLTRGYFWDSYFFTLTLATIAMLNTPFGTLVGYMTLTLPLVIVLQTFALSNIDRNLVQAAHNLGCSPWRSVYQVIIPLAKTGIIIAALFCFILSFGDFVSPYYLGGSKPPTLPILIIDTTKSGQQWPRAAVVAIMMMVTLISIAFAALSVAYRKRANR